MLVAEEVRELMASLGIRRVEELIGRTELLDIDEAIEHWKARGVDLSMVLAIPDLPPDAPRRRTRQQVPVLDDALDWELVRALRARDRARRAASGSGRSRCATSTVRSAASCRARSRAGAARTGLPEETIEISFSGSAGQSFAAWLAPGVTFTLRGETNDYTGKGLSGGIVVVRPPERARSAPRRT